MDVKSFDFKEEKKNDERCVGRIWHVEKKKMIHLGNEVNSILVNIW